MRFFIAESMEAEKTTFFDKKLLLDIKKLKNVQKTIL